jgi:hypothetical protein
LPAWKQLVLPVEDPFGCAKDTARAPHEQQQYQRDSAFSNLKRSFLKDNLYHSWEERVSFPLLREHPRHVTGELYADETQLKFADARL